MVQIYIEAGVPPGVFNVVQGDGLVGQMLTTHPDIAKVGATGVDNLSAAHIEDTVCVCVFGGVGVFHW